MMPRSISTSGRVACEPARIHERPHPAVVGAGDNARKAPVGGDHRPAAVAGDDRCGELEIEMAGRLPHRTAAGDLAVAGLPLAAAESIGDHAGAGDEISSRCPFHRRHVQRSMEQCNVGRLVAPHHAVGTDHRTGASRHGEEPAVALHGHMRGREKIAPAERDRRAVAVVRGDPQLGLTALGENFHARGAAVRHDGAVAAEEVIHRTAADLPAVEFARGDGLPADRVPGDPRRHRFILADLDGGAGSGSQNGQDREQAQDGTMKSVHLRTNQDREAGRNATHG